MMNKTYEKNLSAAHMIIFGLGLGFHVKQVMEHKMQDPRAAVRLCPIVIVTNIINTFDRSANSMASSDRKGT